MVEDVDGFVGDGEGGAHFGEHVVLGEAVGGVESVIFVEQKPCLGIL